MSKPSSLRIHLFGQLEMEWDDTPIPSPRSSGTRSLLAFLVTQAERSFSRDLLAGTFWPERPDPRARRALSQALWQIRRALGPALRPFDRLGTTQAQDTAADRLVTGGDTVTWCCSLTIGWTWRLLRRKCTNTPAGKQMEPCLPVYSNVSR